MDIILKPKFNERKNDLPNEKTKRRCNIALITVLMFIFSVTTVYAVPQFNYITIVDGDYEVNVYTEKDTVEEAVEEQGITLDKYDEVTPSRQSDIYDGIHININRIKKVNVNYGDMEISYYTQAETYAEFIEESQIELSAGDEFSVELSDEIDVESEISVVKSTSENYETKVDVPYSTKKVNDSKLEKGKTKILQEGKKGQKKVVYAIEYRGGKEFSRQLISEAMIFAPVEEIIAVGTKVKITESETKSKTETKKTENKKTETVVKNNTSVKTETPQPPKAPAQQTVETAPAPAPVQTPSPAPAPEPAPIPEPAPAPTPEPVPAPAPVQDSNTVTVAGNTFSFKKKLECSATAYDLSFESTGKRPGDPGYGITASGSYAKRGTVAVDPRVIPLGTKMFIVSADGSYVYGYCTAEDTGGGIKGNKVDLFYDTRAECLQFGRRNVIVYILE